MTLLDFAQSVGEVCRVEVAAVSQIGAMEAGRSHQGLLTLENAVSADDDDVCQLQLVWVVHQLRVRLPFHGVKGRPRWLELEHESDGARAILRCQFAADQSIPCC